MWYERVGERRESGDRCSNRQESLLGEMTLFSVRLGRCSRLGYSFLLCIPEVLDPVALPLHPRLIQKISGSHCPCAVFRFYNRAVVMCASLIVFPDQREDDPSCVQQLGFSR